MLAGGRPYIVLRSVNSFVDNRTLLKNATNENTKEQYIAALEDESVSYAKINAEARVGGSVDASTDFDATKVLGLFVRSKELCHKWTGRP